MEKSESRLDVNTVKLAFVFILGFICCVIFSNIGYNKMANRVKLLEARNANLQMMVNIAAPLDHRSAKGKRIK
jgi:hypothetical protein